MAHIIMALPSGQTITLGEQLTKQLEDGNAPALEGFSVIPGISNKQLENKKQEATVSLEKAEKEVKSAEGKLLKIGQREERLRELENHISGLYSKAGVTVDI